MLLIKAGDASVEYYSATITNRETKVETEVPSDSINEVDGNIKVSIVLPSKGVYDVKVKSTDYHMLDCVCKVVAIDGTLANVHAAVMDTNSKLVEISDRVVTAIGDKVDGIRLVVESINEEVNGLGNSLESAFRIQLDEFKIALEGILTDDVGKILRASYAIEKHLRGAGYTDENGEWVDKEDSVGFAEVLSSVGNMDQLSAIVDSILTEQNVSFAELKESIANIQVTAEATDGAGDIVGYLNDIQTAIDVRGYDILTITSTMEDRLTSIDKELKARFDQLDSKVDTLIGKVGSMDTHIGQLDDKMTNFKPTIYELIET